MENKELKEIFLQVLINNVSEKDLKAYKTIAFEIAMGERNNLSNLLGHKCHLLVDSYIRKDLESITDYVKKHNLVNVDINATLEKMQEQKTDYIRYDVPAEITFINPYSEKPITVSAISKGEVITKSYSSINDIVENNKLEKVNVVYLPEVQAEIKTIEDFLSSDEE